MSVIPSLRKIRAERVVQNGYGDLRDQVFASVRGKLAERNMYFDEGDLDWFYNQAWHGLANALYRGNEIANPGGFLVTIMYRRAVDDYRAQHPDRRAVGADVAELGREAAVDELLDDRAKLRHFIEGLRFGLSERERQVATLCYLHDYTRPQAARMLGIPEKRLQKIMDGDRRNPGVAKRVAAFVADIEAGDWCREHRSTIKAYAFGVLDIDGDRYAFASRHLEACSACKHYVAGLRGLAAALPPVVLPVGKAAGAPAAGAGLAKLHALIAGTASDAGNGAGLAAGGAAGGAAVGSGAAAATSGGLLATKIAVSCVAVVGAGGACVAFKAVENPIGHNRAARAAERSQSRARAGHARDSATPAAGANVPATTSSAGLTEPARRGKSRSRPTQPARGSPDAAGGREFGFEDGSGSPSTQPARSADSTPRTATTATQPHSAPSTVAGEPARSPGGSAGEFGIE
jgi:DNA-directed RNA polymerase specialized sigma24 family protein